MNNYCKRCNRKVRKQKSDFSWPLFLVTGGIPYAIYHVVFKRRKYCPLCKGRVGI